MKQLGLYVLQLDGHEQLWVIGYGLTTNALHRLQFDLRVAPLDYA
jgi:hypothetical protein